MGNNFVRLFRWHVEYEHYERGSTGGRLSEFTLLKLLYRTLCLLLACYLLGFVYQLFDYWMSIIRRTMDDDSI